MTIMKLSNRPVDSLSCHKLEQFLCFPLFNRNLFFLQVKPARKGRKSSGDGEGGAVKRKSEFIYEQVLYVHTAVIS